MSARTELVEVRTVLGNIDLEKAVATVTILSRYKVYRTVTKTNYVTHTLEIISSVVTAINRTYTLQYGDINTSIVTIIPTSYLLTVITRTILPQEEGTGVGGGGQQVPTPIPV